MSNPRAIELFAQVYDLAPANDPSAALKLGEGAFAAMSARPANPHDAETCRLLSLAALHPKIDDSVVADRWRVRATARFALVDWPEGVAATFMSQAFVVLARLNRGYPHGRTLDVIQGSTEPLLMLDELVPFTVRPGSRVSVSERSPSPQLIERFLHEKRGFFELLLKRFDDARSSYDHAAIAARGSARGEIKVGAGRALVDYVAAHATDFDRAPAVAQTAELLAAAERLGEHDLVAQATDNLAEMRNDGTRLVPYELL